MSKKALIIGIDYKGTKDELGGCENDAMAIAKMCNNLGYTIKILTDRDRPTRSKILSEVDRLVMGSRAEDRYYFHYSGHGIQVNAKSSSETDGLDEAFVPSDYRVSGVITDGYMRKRLIESIHPEAMMICSIDACHSGTIMDLPWVLEPNKPLKRKQYSDIGRKAIVFSACHDKQTAKETSGKGIFTVEYLNSLSSAGYNIDPNTLIHSIYNKIKGRQTPQISFGYKPDLSHRLVF